jgi:hypothetical protein
MHGPVYSLVIAWHGPLYERHVSGRPDDWIVRTFRDEPCATRAAGVWGLAIGLGEVG